MSNLYQTLSQVTVEQLRALSWHHAVAAKGTEHADTLCIDPRQFKKADLRTFLATTVSELVEVTMPTKTGWKKMVKAWQETSKEDIAALCSAGGSIEHKLRGSSKRKGAAIQQTVVADDEDDNGNEDDEDEELGEAHENVNSAATSVSNKTLPAKKKNASAARGQHDSPPAHRTVVLCTGCGHHYTNGMQGRFCNNCGKAWATGDNASTASSAGTGRSAHAPPSQWSGLTTFTPRPATAVMTALPARSHNISALPVQVIDKARSGLQFYTLSDLLPNRAPDASDASTSLLDANAFILRFNASGEALTTSSADPSEIASIAKRRRQVSSFAEMAEVFFFSLISVIYLGRPDIQEQLIGLLSLANDISRQCGHAVALTYVDVIRRRHFQSYPPRTHVLLIDTNFDMARLHQDVLLDTITTIRHGSAGSAQFLAAADRSVDTSKSIGPCRNFNNGHPCFYAPCPFPHTCCICNGSGHGSSVCAQSGDPESPTTVASTRPAHGDM
jgi:hypothetical protein